MLTTTLIEQDGEAFIPLPPEVVERLNIRVGDRFHATIRNDTITLTPVTASHTDGKQGASS